MHVAKLTEGVCVCKTYLQKDHDVYDGIAHGEHTPENADCPAVLQVGGLIIEITVLR